MLQGALLLWYLLTIPAVIFVAFDIRHTPEAPIMKWAFVIVTFFMGPIGAFLYVIACREPLPGTHAEYVRNR